MNSSINKATEHLRSYDWWFIGAFIFLVTVGLLLQYTIAANQIPPNFGSVYRQLVYTVIGGVLFFVMNKFDYRVLRTRPWVAIALAAVILVAVLLFGTTIQGTRGWFVIFGVSLQPVEFVKVLIIFFLATMCAAPLHVLRTPKHLLAIAGGVGICVALTMAQPDIGSALLLVVLWYAMMLMIRAPWWLLMGTVVLAVMASAVGWFFLFEDYQKDRLVTFVQPAHDPLGAGYNVTQAIVAVGAGGLWGRGLGAGTQSQLHFLPEVSSDFIFAALAEELGFIGVVTFCLALGLLLFRLWRTLHTTRQRESFFIVAGVFFYFFIQSTLVVGMNIGLLPVTGVPLPLVSAGGSSFIATCLLLGMVHRISVRG